MTDDEAARLQRLEDHLAIHRLFIDYGHHLDAGDFDAYAELFHEDGEVLLGPMGRARGRAEIKALMTRAIGDRVGDTFHLVTSPMIDVDGDRATATVMWTVLERGDDGKPVVSMLGRHHDVLARDGERWRFLRRAGAIDLPSQLAES